MQGKIDRAGRETRQGGGANHQLLRIRRCRSRSKPGRESEGFIVLFEVLGQHNPALREGTLLCVRFQRVEDQEIAAMPVIPMKIRTLQRKLYAKAKQEPGYRFML